MMAGTMLLIVFSFFLLMICLGIPIAYGMIITSIGFILFFGRGFEDIIIPFTRLGLGISFPLLAIFLFIALGNAMNETKIASYLVDFLRRIFRIFLKNGRMGAITIFSCLAMGPMTGSANATATSIGVIMIPQMNKSNYSKKYSTTLLAYSGILGSLIPPSITGVVYAILLNLPILGVWTAVGGVGLVYGLGLLVTNIIIAKKRGYESIYSEDDSEEVKPNNGFKKSFIKVFPALMIPIGVFGAIYGGIVTPVEAGAAGTFVTLLLGIFYYKTIQSFRHFIKIIYISSYQTAVIMFLVCASFSLSYVFISTGSIKHVTNSMLMLTNNKYILLLLVEGLLLITGCFMDNLPAMIILAPIGSAILLPLGIHPYHLASVIIYVCLVGLVTPPVGTVLYAASAIANVSVGNMLREILIFFIPTIIILFLITFFPCISLFLPKLFGLL